LLWARIRGRRLDVVFRRWLACAGRGFELRAALCLLRPLYTHKLIRVKGQWLIESLQIRHNLPFAF
jgi:hypothetical protein